MYRFSPRKFLSTQAKSKTYRRVKFPTFHVESLEDRTVLSHPAVLTVGVGYEYATITDALAAAHSKDVIDVYPGTYNEAVTISKNGIKLVGEGPGVVVQPTSVAPVTLSGVDVGGAAIDVYANNVTVNGITVDGSLDADTNLWAGIRVIEGGSATIENNTVTGMLYGAPNTDVGIQIGTSLVSGDNGSGIATVSGNTVVDYAGTGVLVDGAGAGATVQDNTITGIGTANKGISEYGVQVSNGASARVQYNVITNNTIDGDVAGGYNPTPASAGVFFYNDGNTNSVAALNVIAYNDDGILVQQSNGQHHNKIQVVDNTIQQNYGYAGIFVLSSNNVIVTGNAVSNNTTLNGIALNLSSKVQVDSNCTFGNVNADGIYDFKGNDDQIARNNSYSNGNNGINVDTSTGDQLIYNTTWKNVYSGVQITGGSNNSIWVGNSSVNDQDGIILINTTGNSILGNVLSYNGGSGIQLVNAQNTVIGFNSTYGNVDGAITVDSQSSGTLQIRDWSGDPHIKFGKTWANGYKDTFCFTYADSDDEVRGLGD